MQARFSKNDVDIVIPVYGKFDLLTRCLSAIPAAIGSFRYKIFLFDNASPEGADEFYSNLKESGSIPPDQISIFRSKTNIGFPSACNRAAMKGVGDYVFLLNTDCIMHPGSIEQLIRMMKADNTIGVSAPMLLFPSEQELIDTGFTTDEVIMSRPPGKVQHIGLDTSITGDIIHTLISWSPENPKVMKVDTAYAVTGAALLTRRFIWNKIGGFWEGYGLGTYEDVDYCLTVRGLGYNIKIVPSAVGTHYVGATALSYQMYYPLNENKAKFLQRWGNKLQYTEWERW